MHSERRSIKVHSRLFIIKKNIHHLSSTRLKSFVWSIDNNLPFQTTECSDLLWDNMAFAIGLLVATSLTLPILYTRGPNFISYYIKFGIYYLSFCSLTILYTPYFVLRGRTAEDPYFITRHWIWICKWTLGLRWEFSNSDVELTLHLRNSIKGGAVIGKPGYSPKQNKWNSLLIIHYVYN